MIEQKTDLVQEALDKLLGFLKDQPNIEALLSALVQPIQDLEDVAFEVLSQDTVDGASGDQLDLLGRLLGQAREGRTDADYRPWLQARIRLNRSSGQTEEILSLIASLVPDGTTLELKEYDPAAFTLIGHPMTNALATQMAKLLQLAKAAGVQGVFEWRVSETNTFRLSTAAAYLDSDSLQGFGNTSNSHGGVWASASEG